MNKIPRQFRKQLDDKALEIDPAFKQSLKNSLFEKEQPMAKQAKQSTIERFTQFLKANNAVPLLAVFLALVAVGGTSALITNNRAEQSREAEIALPAELEGVLSVEDIQSIALLEDPGLSISSIELENEDEGLLYKVEFNDGSVRYYLASDGSPVTRANDDSYEEDDSVPAGFQAGISIAEARTIAQNQRPGKTITKIELETEDGVVVYSVRFSDDGRVDVNASNGNVMRVRNGESQEDSRRDSSDDDDKDDDDRSGSSSDDDDDDDEDDDRRGSSRDDDDEDDDDDESDS